MSITLVTQETMYHELAARALTETMKHISVDRVLVFSNQHVIDGADHVHVDHFPNVHNYCEFMLRGMNEHVTTDHVLFVQWDAMAYNQECWTNEFLEYDYIGAPWPWYEEGKNIGNGGFSLRSKRLLEALQDTAIQMDPNNPAGVNEDQVIGYTFRPYLEEKYGIKYPSTKLASQFSYELGKYQPSFGFHGPWNVIKFCDLETVEFYVQNMSYIGWNIHKWHHFLFELTARQCYNMVVFAMDQLETHSPELLGPVVSWLGREQHFWAQFNGQFDLPSK